MNKRMLSNRQVAQTCLRFQYFISAGTSIPEAFELMAEDEEDRALAGLFRSMAEDAADGSMPGEIFEKTGAFPPHVSRLLKAGDRTGRLEEALGAVAEYCRDREAMEQQLKQAVVHPAVLVLVMLAVTAVLLEKVLPVFQQVYRRLGAVMTGPGAAFLALGKGLRSCMPLVWLVFGLAAGLLCMFAFSDGFRRKLLAAWQKKGKGPWALAARADFAGAFSMAVSSGFDAEEAVSLALEQVKDVPFLEEAGAQCLKLLAEGETAAESLKKSGLATGSYAGLIGAGFRSGRPEEAAAKGAQVLAEEAKKALNDRLLAIEPVLVLLLTVLLGGILLSVMLPLLSLMTAMG